MINPEKTSFGPINFGDPPLLVFKGCGSVYVVTTAGTGAFLNAAGDTIPGTVLNGPGGSGQRFEADAEIYAIKPSALGGAVTVEVWRWF